VKRLKSLLLALPMYPLAAHSGHAECNYPGFLQYCDNCTLDRVFETQKNVSCSVTTRFDFGLKSIAVITKARNGTAGVFGNSYGYRPNKDFVGEDTFRVRVRYFVRDGSIQTTTLNVRVLVR